MPRRRAALLLVALVLLAGCGGSSAPEAAEPGTGPAPGFSTSTVAETIATTTTAPPPEVADLTDRAYVAAPADVSGYDLVAGTELRLGFDGRILTASAGCATLTAPYTLVEGRLSWSVAPVASSGECPGERILQDRWLIGRLIGGLDVAVADEGLILTEEDLVISARRTDDAPGSPSTALFDATWRLVTTIDDGTASPVPAGVPAPTLQIPEPGVAELFGGCNPGSASIEIDDEASKLRFASVSATSASCGTAADALEEVVRSVLDGDTFFQVVDDTLTITKGSSALIFRSS